MEVILTEPSINDLKTIYNRYLSRRTATKYILELLDYIETLEEMPYLGKTIDKSKFYHIRQLIFRKHKIIYQIQNNTIYIHAIMNNSRNLEIFLNQLSLFS